MPFSRLLPQQELTLIDALNVRLVQRNLHNETSEDADSDYGSGDTRNDPP